MNEPLDELYLKWLYSQVANVKLKNPTSTYWHLLRQLYSKEFIWIIPNDDNRLEDGRDLRVRFVNAANIHDVDPLWFDMGCSVLEMLVALAHTLNFEDESRDVGTWFWTMMHNAKLDHLNDSADYFEEDVNEILDGIIWRTYRKNGRGGLFPLKRPNGDQCDVELWYQMNAYILENN